MSQTQTSESTATQFFTIIRVFEAPREVVYRAWTEREQFIRWWGPKEYTVTYCTNEFRVGGAIHYCLTSPDGEEFWCSGVVKYIDAPSRYACTTHFSDREGNLLLPCELGMSAHWPAETTLIVTFEDVGHMTQLTLIQEGITEALAETFGASIGWIQSFDKLDILLAGGSLDQS